MTAMDPERLDLNLLRVFAALDAERHVTRAAARLGLTQSAVSNALRRLRAAFDDELFQRTPAGMEPTALAREVEAALEAEGCAIVGPVPTVGRALSLLDGPEAPSLDAALLDVNLRGEMVTPVARLLADRGLPFVLVTGYDG